MPQDPVESDEPADEQPPEPGNPDFYWKQGRENLTTEAGLKMFQLTYAHKDEPYDTARATIDAEYEALSPRLQRKGRPGQRHGGPLTNYIVLFEELGLMYRETTPDGTILRATPAGDQAAILLHKVPDYLKAVPYFLSQILCRYRFNNPLNRNEKNRALAKENANSDMFPYWTLFHVMRESGDYITKDELARFVFKTKRMEEIPTLLRTIDAYRRDIIAGLEESALTEKYGAPLTGAIAQPKYIMGRAGVQQGIIEQQDDIYRINPSYLNFVDELLSTPPTFEDLDEQSWIREYGQALDVNGDASEWQEPLIDDTDPIFHQVTTLLHSDKFAGVILIGPPGTGKSWYARQIAIKLTAGDPARLREVQFHPSYQYEDFVEGYVPDTQGGFRLDDKHLLSMCTKASQSKSGAVCVLVIDELSRTDPARVMGEAMTYMESSLRGVSFSLPSGRRAFIPPNLIFLATMNPEDRSVDDIDAAMDRRWGKVYLAPDVAVLRSFLTEGGMSPESMGQIADFFVWLQPHFKLGHAFFRTIRDNDSLKRLWNNQLQFTFGKAFKYDPETLKKISDRWAEMMQKLEGESGPVVA